MKLLLHSSHCGFVSSVMPLLAQPAVQSQEKLFPNITPKADAPTQPEQNARESDAKCPRCAGRISCYREA